MGLRAKEIVLGPDAQRAYERLRERHDHDSVSIVRKVRYLKPILLADCQYGEDVKKGRITRPLRLEHGLENLYDYDLPYYRRLLYTTVHLSKKTSLDVEEIVDHDRDNIGF